MVYIYTYSFSVYIYIYIYTYIQLHICVCTSAFAPTEFSTSFQETLCLQRMFCFFSSKTHTHIYIYIYTCVWNTLHIYIKIRFFKKKKKNMCAVLHINPWPNCMGWSLKNYWGSMGCHIDWDGGSMGCGCRLRVYGDIMGYTGISNLGIPFSHLSLGYDHPFKVCGPPICWGPLSKMRVSGVSNNLWISFPIGWLVEGFLR